MIEKELVSDEFVRSIDVHGILPQQEPFVMVGRLSHFEMMTSTTETVVDKDNIFVEDGFLSPFGLMENIAQTCAARIGFYNKYILHKEVQVGYVGAVREYEIFGRAKVGSVVTTTVDVIEEIFGMTLADATILCDGEEIAKANIKLAVDNIDQ